ncbi:MAG: IgGFc-binding protein [Flavobacteriaceae bacterium]|jgi:hypothetical protein|nr:IgGFc-binding protein [Flavobacteriaceae bacterium]
MLTLFLLCTIIHAQKKSDCENNGSEFMFVFSNPNALKILGGVEKIEMSGRLHIEGTPSEAVQINNKEYIIPPDGYLIVEEAFPPVPYEFSDKNIIRINARSAISVNAERASKFSAHNFPVIPVSLWGKEYIIPGYEDQSKMYKVNNFIDIIAKNNKTHVSITDTEGNIIKKITLKAGQNYEYNSIEDLTGYSIKANKNIGVISGNHCLKISAACDHTALMLYDTSKLGTHYYNSGTSFFSNTAIHRLVAFRDNTEIKIDGQPIAVLKKGEYYEYHSEDPHVIESSDPILAYLIFDRGSVSDPEHSVDPSSILLPSVNNAVTSAKFTFPDHMIYSKDIQIIMKTDRIHTFRVDNHIPDAEWNPFPYDSLVSYATLSFYDNYPHSLSTTEPNTAFIPLLMARGMDVSLGTTLKTGFHNLFTGEDPNCPEKRSSNQKEEIPSQNKTDKIFLTDTNKPILVEKKVIDVLIFDNAQEDGDIISIYLNDILIYPNVQVLKDGVTLEVTLEKGQNTLDIKAENEGGIYPNTAGITFDDGKTLQTLILHNKKGQSKSLKIISR